ncbi:MAG: shikimate dehydrogenase [Croceibacterium sp.]
MIFAEVIGDPIAQSKSPAIHTYWLGQMGLQAEYRACRVASEDLAAYLEDRRENLEWRGCNVTMPLKQAVKSLLYSVEAPADRVGAVNTIYPGFDRLLVGTNTDAAGFLEPLRPLLANRHLFRMARVLGTGGAARAIVTALAEQHCVIVLAGRDPAKARALLDELDPGGEHHAADLAQFADPTSFVFDDRAGCFDLVVNASPLGMAGQPPLAFDLSHVPPGSVVYDIVTHPLDTPLLQAARAAGFQTIDGLSMLIGQAAIAFEKFFGVPPPREEGDTGLRALLAP